LNAQKKYSRSAALEDKKGTTSNQKCFKNINKVGLEHEEDDGDLNESAYRSESNPPPLRRPKPATSMTSQMTKSAK
jgi:hypothetical protein